MAWGVDDYGWTRFSRVERALTGVPMTRFLMQTPPGAHLCTWPRMHPEKQRLSMRLWQDPVLFCVLENVRFYFPLSLTLVTRWAGLWGGLWQFPTFVSKSWSPLRRGELPSPHPSLKGIPQGGADWRRGGMGCSHGSPGRAPRKAKAARLLEGLGLESHPPRVAKSRKAEAERPQEPGAPEIPM